MSIPDDRPSALIKRTVCRKRTRRIICRNIQEVHIVYRTKYIKLGRQVSVFTLDLTEIEAMVS